MRVFLDANVIFSAAYRETGSSRALFALGEAGACGLVSSGYAVEEARRNIRAKHAGRSDELESLMRRLAICREPAPETLAWASTLGLPPKDAPILAAAIDARCHLLVTGDRTHFGPMFGRRLRGTVVMMPTEALGLLVGEE